MSTHFENPGQKEGIEIWRIKDFKVVPYPVKDYGKFYTGDSFIVLYTAKSLRDWNIHFWLGTETSQDEAGTAAILSVKLDDQLGGGPVQYREVQDHESDLFLSLFKNGIRYLPGGFSSGFKHVEHTKETRLFQVKGVRNVRVKQVDVSINSMNDGDCFILDNGETIFVYFGKNSRRIEKIKANNAAIGIRDQDHNGKAELITVEEGSPESDYKRFFEVLGGGSKDQVPQDTGDDAEFEKGNDKVATLYRVSDASGKLEVTKVAEKCLKQSMLDENDCFILDTGVNIFVWVGKKCTTKEKTESMSKAEQFLKTKNYPSWTSIQRIIQGSETGSFTQHFETWKHSIVRKYRMVRADSNLSDADFEPRLIHAEIRKPGGKFLTEEVYHFTQDDLYEDDIMLLDHGIKLFVWIGKGASDEEKSKSASLAKDYASKLPRSVEIITVNQGEEGDNFKKAFPSWK